MAKLLRDGGYSYHQSKHLIAEARQRVGLTPLNARKVASTAHARRDRGPPQRCLCDEWGTRDLDTLAFRNRKSSRRFLPALCGGHSFAELEVRVRDKGGKTRDVPILQSLANEIRIHLGDRRTGFVFPSPRGGAYSKRRIQQIVKELATVAKIQKSVYPHLLRHTIAQRLADQGMPENLLPEVPRARESANDPGLLPGVPASSEASLPRGDGAWRVMASSSCFFLGFLFRKAVSFEQTEGLVHEREGNIGSA